MGDALRHPSAPWRAFKGGCISS
ncbi:hypothetical protein GIV81_26255, partial [Pseudomonas syringae]|nr:hypothetical protein [Pseudomonas syringae]